MARLALTVGGTVVGAAAGYFLGNPLLGAQIGYAAGSIAGALLFPAGEDQTGPRLGDLRVGDASYGVPIPRVWGTGRIAGNMIWTSGIQEESSEETQSQSGGGPTVTTYRYYSSFAIGLCAGPIAAVRKNLAGYQTGLRCEQHQSGDCQPAHRGPRPARPPERRGTG